MSDINEPTEPYFVSADEARGPVGARRMPSFADGVEAAEDMHERAWAQEAERGNLDKAEWHRECAAHLRAIAHTPQAASNDWNPDRLGSPFPTPHFDGETQIPAGQHLTLGQMAAILVGAGLTVERRPKEESPAFIDEAEAALHRLWGGFRNRDDAFHAWAVQYGPALITAARKAAERRTRPTHRHKKRGTEYVLIGYGTMQAKNWHRVSLKEPAPPFSQSVDMREVVIYRSVDDDSLWVRPREEFEDGRFEVLK